MCRSNQDPEEAEGRDVAVGGDSCVRGRHFRGGHSHQMDVQAGGAEDWRALQDPVREEDPQTDRPGRGPEHRGRVHRRGGTPAVQRPPHRGG